MIVMAHLKTKATRRDPQARLVWKLSLVKRLYEKGYERRDIVELFRFIDWLLRLPDELEPKKSVRFIDIVSLCHTQIRRQFCPSRCQDITADFDRRSAEGYPRTGGPSKANRPVGNPVCNASVYPSLPARWSLIRRQRRLWKWHN